MNTTYSSNPIVVPNPSYQVAEHLTGCTWINGKPIYRQVIDFGACPATAVKDVALPGGNVIDEVTRLDVVTQTGTSRSTYGGAWSKTAGGNRIVFTVRPATPCVRGHSAGDFSATTAWVIVEYTKV